MLELSLPAIAVQLTKLLVSTHITSNLRGIHNAWHFCFYFNLVFMAQCFRFGWRRCSPLNWALGAIHFRIRDERRI
ncbi:hypothetical protein D8T53_21655 [Vibrio vulnificus]|nr:hypothetical protein D8T53_21655 [Vibrio vulnificus]